MSYYYKLPNEVNHIVFEMHAHFNPGVAGIRDAPDFVYSTPHSFAKL